MSPADAMAALRGAISANPSGMGDAKPVIMPNDCTVYHVMPNLPVDEWVVRREDDASFFELFPTKETAVLAAKRRALREGAAQVKVHDGDGNVEDR